jgi:uncharacterized delta-60 repeat protein
MSVIGGHKRAGHHFPLPRPGRGSAGTRRSGFCPAVERLEDRQLLSTGALDVSFSLDGKANVAFDLGGSFDDRAAAVAVQPDGKIVVVGSAQRNGTGDYDFAVARLNPDGSFDTTFDGDGKRTVAFDLGGSFDDRATAVALQPDGKIVVAGRAQFYDADYDFAVARLNPDGSFDTTFDGDGKRTFAFDLGGGNFDGATGVAVRPDGRIVLAGSAQRDASGNRDFAVARLTSTGALDTTFNGTGKQTVAFDLGGSNVDVAAAVTLQPDGRIVLAGYTQRNATGDYDFAVARLASTGALDTTFDGDGKRTIFFDRGGGLDDRAASVALQPDGKIVVAGSAQYNATGDYDFAVARLTSTGALDTTFDGDGKRTIAFDLGGGNEDRVAGVALQADGKIVLVGSAQRPTAGDYDFAVARLDAGGALDTSFDYNGKRVIYFDRNSGKNDRATGVAIAPDGKIVVAGFSQYGTGTDFDFAVARFGLAPQPPVIEAIIRTEVVVPVPVVTGDVTPILRLVFGKLKMRGGRATQTVTIGNASGQVVQGPLALVLDHLPRRVKLLNASGLYRSGGNKSPYVTALGGGTLGSGQESGTLTLRFRGVTSRRLRFASRLLAGFGPAGPRPSRKVFNEEADEDTIADDGSNLDDASSEIDK